MREPFSRRTFARQLATGALAAGSALVPPAAAQANLWASEQTGEPAASGSDVDACDNATPQEAEERPALPSPEDLLLAFLIQRYPSPHFTTERLIGIRAGLRRNLAQSEQLRQFPLANSDAPAMIFRAVPPRR